MNIIYHPGTGTIIAADECMVLDTTALADEGYGDDYEETIANVDVNGIDLGALLDAVSLLRFVGHGVPVSRFDKKGQS